MNGCLCHPRRFGTALIFSLLVISSRSEAGILVIDPGHGGSDSGAPSAIAGYWEKTINLQVALALCDTLVQRGYENDWDFFLTRDRDTTLTLQRRADLANGHNANEFICIHHNTPSTTNNYTRTSYCDAWLTPEDPPQVRDSSALLAAKIGFRIGQELRLPYTKQPECTPGSPLCVNWYYVLRYTTMASAYPEASFISNLEEAHRFHDSSRAEQEAGAVYRGWASYVMHGGLGIVMASYNGGTDGIVSVDNTQRDSPFYGTWEHGEHHDLSVPPEQWFADNYRRTFYRWAHPRMWWDWWYQGDSSQNELRYETAWWITVGTEEEYHAYTAYYKGGPYYASIAAPYDTVYVTDTVMFVWRPGAAASSRDTINWHVDVGADSTSVIKISLDRNGGSGGYPQTILGPGYFDQLAGWYWLAGVPGTGNAKLRITANDYAGNAITNYSTPFVIYDCGQLAVTDETMSSNTPAITELYLDYDCNKDHNLDLTIYRRDGKIWTQVAGWCQAAASGHTHVVWTIDPPLTEANT